MPEAQGATVALTTAREMLEQEREVSRELRDQVAALKRKLGSEAGGEAGGETGDGEAGGEVRSEAGGEADGEAGAADAEASRANQICSAISPRAPAAPADSGEMKALRERYAALMEQSEIEKRGRIKAEKELAASQAAGAALEAKLADQTAATARLQSSLDRVEGLLDRSKCDCADLERRLKAVTDELNAIREVCDRSRGEGGEEGTGRGAGGARRSALPPPIASPHIKTRED